MLGYRIYFYATREDLEPVIHSIEVLMKFNYALTGLHTSLSFPVYSSALEIPTLGQATQDSAVGCDSYLVVPIGTQIVIREVPQISGGVRYAVDQLVNPDSIRFQSGGVREGGIIIHGLVDTTGQSNNAKVIFKIFKKYLTKSFMKQQAFYVGRNAIQLKEQGVRLTAAVQSAHEYDLA